MSRIIEFHVIKNYPYSNLNRDEAGTPKTALFGGVNRGRISSQSLKRSWRKCFDSMFELPVTSKRTRRMPVVVRNKLVEMGIEEEIADVLMEMLAKSFGKNEKRIDSTGQIVPLGNEEISAISEYASGIIGDKSAKELRKEYLDKNGGLKPFTKELGKKTANCGNAVDIALFGRMATTDTISDVEAAMQVAHAISTNRLEMEEDFFTAVDDIMTSDEDLGAGMMGVIEHDSCCYYEYMSLNIDILKENLKYNDNADEIISRIVPAFIKTIAFSNPSGKSNSTGSHELPSAILVEAKDVPYNLSNAFVKPVESKGEGLIHNSVQALADYCDKMDNKYGLPAQRAFFSVPEVTINCGHNCETFGELLDYVSTL